MVKAEKAFGLLTGVEEKGQSLQITSSPAQPGARWVGTCPSSGCGAISGRATVKYELSEVTIGSLWASRRYLAKILESPTWLEATRPVLRWRLFRTTNGCNYQSGPDFLAQAESAHCKLLR